MGRAGSFKSIYGVAKAAVPILYGIYLLSSLLDDSGPDDGLWGISPGPAAIGLGAVALLFLTPKILKLARTMRGARIIGLGPAASDDSDGDDGGAAADAIIARYMAREAEEAKAAAIPAPRPAPRPAPPAARPANRPSFGRKT